MIDDATAAEWVQRWDHQQEHYADHREARFSAMVDLVERATAPHEHPVVVDIGAGPGSLAARLADRLPCARVVAVESDPFLVALGRAWCGEVVEFAAETAGSPGWRDRLELPQVHAVVASSALHYPSLARLRALYVELAEWVSPTGVVVNADHFPDLDESGSAQLADLGPWTGWWDGVAASAGLAPLLAERTRRAVTDPAAEEENNLGAAEHVALLTAAGFTRVELAWRRDRSGIVVAHPS